MAQNDSPPLQSTLPINTTAAQLDKFLKGMEGVASPAIQALVISLVPELGLPIVKQIVDGVEAITENYITKQVELGATFIVIDVQTTEEISSLSQAQKEILLAEISGNPAAIAEAEQDYANAESALVKDDGGAQPL